ncbi:hypothetical protein HO133_006739 [Letharia lupina]|uniref:Uncharacterized protein n=1 Tax=Letharia lupina TaxID=560253 RepID=A0A8H6C5Y7_9LECA|nr:uncharacterized protein HO133_006739 [Letharia lupina]KAF6217637.1 hypothetical protein HO133_006739 [Letharia lupina]
MDLQTLSSALPPPRPSLLGIPLELRNEIYRNLLSTGRNRIDLGLGRARYSLQTAVLATNRQIHDEATAVLRENRFINIITSWTSFKQDILVQGKFPIIAEGDDRSPSPESHMLVLLDFMGDVDTSRLYAYVTCLADLPHLCRLLFYASSLSPNFSSLLHVTLAIRDPQGRAEKTVVPKALQEALMMPFAVLKGLHGLTIKGARNKAVEKELRKAMGVPNPTAAEYLEAAAGLKDAGNAAFKVGDYALSIRIYIQAYEAMHFIVEGKRFAIMLDGYFASNPLTGGRFEGQRGDLVRHHLGSQLSWNILAAYLKMEDWEQAYFWGERAISDIEYADVQQSILDGTPNLVTGAEKAKVYWRMAVASQALDRKQVWARSLMKAYMFAPQDKTIMREMEALEKRLQRHELDLEDFKP